MTGLYVSVSSDRWNGEGTDVLSRGRLLLGFRSLSFAIGLSMGAGFPLIFLIMGDPARASCFAHWSYGVGEFIALLGVLTLGLRRLPVTVAIHAVLTVGWIFLVSKNCALWLALWSAAGLPHAPPHAM